MTEREAIVAWLREAAQNLAEAGSLSVAMYLQSLTDAIEAGQHLENKDATDVI